MMLHNSYANIGHHFYEKNLNLMHNSFCRILGDEKRLKDKFSLKDTDYTHFYVLSLKFLDFHLLKLSSNPAFICRETIVINIIIVTKS